MKISVVIASLNEKDNLVATVASVKADCPDAEIIVVDDGSAKPEPVAAIRNPRRIGGPRSRRLGGLAAKGDVVIFLDAHNALDWETANWFAKRYPEVGPVRPEFREALDRPNKLRTLAAAALGQKYEGRVMNDEVGAGAGFARTSSLINHPSDLLSIVYGGCLFAAGRSGFTLVHEKGLYGGRWVKRRPDLPPLVLWRTPALMGAFYAIPRGILDDFGGWPALPNFHGAQELAVALLAMAHGVPIYFHSGVALWHLFRGMKNGVKPPFDLGGWNASFLGYPAAWRLVLDDAHWYGASSQHGRPQHGGTEDTENKENTENGDLEGSKIPSSVASVRLRELRVSVLKEDGFRARLAAGQGPHGAIPEHVLAQVETDEFNRCRADAQSRFKLTSDELLAEMERQIAQNREERIQGAEDRALNTSKKILLAITFSADAGTSSNDATLADKGFILGRVLESARASGADGLLLCANGDAIAVRGSPALQGIPVAPSGENVGLPLGETRMVRSAIAYARQNDFEWIVKICGDVFHPRPNWAKEMVRRAVAAPNGAALIAGICEQKCTVTKVFAARTDFLSRTWPEESEVAPLGSGAVLERLWTAKIARLGLTNLWLPLETKRVFEGKANWTPPTDPALSYLHTHDAAVAAKWKMEKA